MENTTQKDLQETLKPCPFCGKEPKLATSYCVGHGDMSIGYVVKCTNAKCGVFSHTLVHAKKEDAIKAWNTRA